VSVKKAKGNKKRTAKKAGKKSASENNSKPVDMVRVRENINNMVKNSARKIATEVIKVAKTGQLASARYLFEAVGLYPATEQTEARPIETSLAHTLLKRMGLPLEPVVCDDDETPAVPSAAKGAETKATGIAEEDLACERDEGQVVPAEGED
jgi:hypothetical protein